MALPWVPSGHSPEATMKRSRRHRVCCPPQHTAQYRRLSTPWPVPNSEHHNNSPKLGQFTGDEGVMP